MDEEHQQLTQRLEDMDLPKLRKTLNSSNIHWLLRNISVRNDEHPRFKEAVALLRGMRKSLRV